MSSRPLSAFGPLHNLHLEIFELLEDRIGCYLCLDRCRAGGPQRGRKTFVKIHARVPRDFILLLSIMKIDQGFPRTRMEFRKGRDQWSVRTNYPECETWDYEGEVIPSVKEIISFSRSFHRSKYGT